MTNQQGSLPGFQRPPPTSPANTADVRTRTTKTGMAIQITLPSGLRPAVTQLVGLIVEDSARVIAQAVQLVLRQGKTSTKRTPDEQSSDRGAQTTPTTEVPS